MMAKKPRRILMILENESYPEDTRVFQEANSLIESGFDVSIVCPAGEKREWTRNVEGVKAYYYPDPWESSGFVGYVLEFAHAMFWSFLLGMHVLLRHGFDAVHVHAPPDMNALVALVFKLFGKKVVFDHHDLSPELYDAQRHGKGNRTVKNALLWFERTAVRIADRLISTNESQQRVQIERGGADPRHCYVVRNGPHTSFLEDVAPHPAVAKDSRIKLGFVGMIGVQDGVNVFVDALAELKKRRSDFLAVIVGKGPALERLQQQTRSLGLSDHIQFTGMVPYSEVPSYIAAFDICVTPDPSNPYNDSCTTIKTMEYMALGRPTVAFETRENQITAGDSALYASNNDVVAFANHIEQLMDNPALRQEMGSAGRARIEELFSWRKQEQNLIRLYCDLFSISQLQGEPPKTNARISPRNSELEVM